ncbi:MAG: triose-phosphate isomerase [Candidatus Paceibacterota bacterium]|jgi:triosephosphate isomerase
MKKNNKILLANWKMAPETPEIAHEIFGIIKRKMARTKRVEAVICPSYLYLENFASKVSGRRFSIGAQDVFWETTGQAFTGQVSAPMVKAVGAQYVIVGHSERRSFGETDVMVNKKILSSLKAGLIPILCVGESERDSQINYLDFLKDQIKSALVGVKKSGLVNLIIAYEPVWAISTFQKGSINPSDLHEAIIFVRKVVADLYDRETAMSLRVVYGGSVSEENVGALLRGGEADGLLVGKASLNPETFGALIKIADSFK